ncbi:MAG: hypothetical protein JXA30_02050 [Deltaproteobacteria bacterium]|nr:hypothetical protein [Deltaproteobacteria bacterium]
MVEQLDLFTRMPVPVLETAQAPDEQPVDVVSASAQVLPEQTDLFGDRWLRASAAHDALRSFDLEGAAEALGKAVMLYPTDTKLLQRAELVSRLADRLRQESRNGKSLAEALAAIEALVPAFLAAQWHRRLAESMEAERGTGATFDGVPAGLHWLRAGDAIRAEQSLRSTVANAPTDCRMRGYLADALAAQQRLSQARVVYRDALSTTPWDVDFTNLVDIAVRDLPRLAKYEYELPSAPVEWSASVGLIEGVFLPPVVDNRDWLDPMVLERLVPGLRFFRWLVAERAARDNEQRIACRREMKALSPSLLKRLLQPER